MRKWAVENTLSSTYICFFFLYHVLVENGHSWGQLSILFQRMNKIAERMNKSQDLLKTLVFRLELLMIIHYFSQSSFKNSCDQKRN